MPHDPSRGWNAIASDFMAARREVGVEIVRDWAGRGPAGGAVVDLGCGDGWPVSTTLIEAGFQVFGVDASPVLVEAFRLRLPGVPVACEPVETSPLFDRSFDGAVAIGLVFLLPEADQSALITRVARALNPGGRFLFTAPAEACVWTDTLTGQPSRSLGEGEYRRLLEAAGLSLINTALDAGGNCYLEAVKAR
ncbi:MAG: class I SAM-dependent methyltransferase [Brevundimonas sp.]|uniref:class I SAM-dependent methyltransferase n=1 Tax=Brevundimonas sp. TaxID=1871086 RepID=UPI002733CE8C|nr:class I SAM-dependent methyltransferase [Brevundimonas sp.]MDP3405897.1 class I SAM-dependent methyltransferase [Brevundimonas sp.]